MENTRNLAIANRSCISSAHTVTTVTFHRVVVSRGNQAYGTQVAVAAAGSISFSVSQFFLGGSFSWGRSLCGIIVCSCSVAVGSQGGHCVEAVANAIIKFTGG